MAAGILKEIIKKGLKKSPVLGGRVRRGTLKRGTPTAAGLIARRNALRGAPTADKYRKAIRGTEATKAPKKKPLIGKTEKGIGIGVLSTLAYQELRKSQKQAKAKEDKKLKKATDKKKAEDEKKKKSYGKRAPKRSKYYKGR